ncbi:DUF885 domain-containing protein [Pseudoxanthomonas sp. CAU 1598]|uniref:DUF885 domain-containing protein n=2 Tax=Pseudomarimonas arenosa TaxID=2774145 RepID=A0AAW3ZM17_9GAMM|nr:DUF885 family protein [Pseudomarimonas arenosa]MBD8527101.1 DUF885 domain-containing protein [Pseudomarimonas arenosa]
MRKILLSLAIAAALSACGANTGTAPQSESPPATSQPTKQVATATQLDALYAEFWEASLKLNPVQATFTGDNRYNDQLPNFFSAEFRQQTKAFAEQWLAKVEALDPSGLDSSARISYDIFVNDLKQQLEGERYPRWMLPINQFGSVFSFLPQLGSGAGAQPFATVEDYDNWLKRAHLAVALFDSAIDNMRQGIKAGVVQPRVLMEKVLPQLQAVVSESADTSMFWGPISRMPESFPAADKQRLTEEFSKLINDGLNPGYQRLHDFIRDEYLPATRDTVAFSALPDGQAWYAFNVRNQTTTDLTPAEIHDIGLAEVARIQGEMRRVMEQVEFKGELSDFFKFVTEDAQFTFASEQALLDGYNGLREKIDAKVPELFSLIPKSPFEIRPVEAFRAKSAAGGQYFPPSADGSRPGIFYVNTYDLPSRKVWDMESLYLHEAIPGHHFQIALQQELTDLPAFRRFGGETAFAEGWGLYAESLGKDLGVYTDPYQYFGRLQAELWRSIRLVVDTGLHSKNWSREQVIQYMLENSATTETEAVAEAERYIAIPGQALAYKIGELKILELRKKAEQALGDKFDIRDFHAEVLRDGAVPLSVLSAKIDRWIASRQGS